MKPNIKLLLIAVLCSFQFISCKKEDSVSIDSSVNASDATELIAKTNLVAWYKFTNGSTNDSSGKNNNLTKHHVTLTVDYKGRPNNAFLFNGKGSFMSAENSASLNPTSAITIAALIKPTGFYSGTGSTSRILMKGEDDQSNGVYFIGFFNSGKVYGSYGDNQFSSNGVVSTDHMLKRGNWYKLIYTYDGVVGKLYINDTLSNTSNNHATFTPNGDPLLIGKTSRTDFPYYFKGAIDEIRIYNKALNRSQVTSVSEGLGN